MIRVEPKQDQGTTIRNLRRLLSHHLEVLKAMQESLRATKQQRDVLAVMLMGTTGFCMWLLYAILVTRP